MSKRLFLIFHGRYPSEKAAGLFAFESVKAFQVQGYEVTLLAPRRRSAGGGEAVYLPTLDLFGFLPNTLAFRLSFFVFSISTYLYLLFSARRDSIIYSNESLPLFFATASFPNTYLEMHDYPEHFHSLYQFLFARVRGILITNRGKEEQLHKDFPSTQSKTLVEKNAVAFEQFATSLSRQEARTKLNLPLDAKIVVYTGHLYAWKGVDTLAQAAPRLSANVLVYFVGGTEVDLARMKKEWGETKNIRFIGHRSHDEMPLWQRAADVLVLPNTGKESISARDTSPMKLLEYMASGTPIVASRLPSILEILPPESAYFATADDPKSFVEQITLALESNDVATKIRIAEEWVREHTWEKRAARVTKWFEGLPDRREAYRHERIIFYTSLSVVAIFILFFIGMHGLSPSFGSLQSDSYLGLAVSLYERGVFTLSTTAPYLPHVTHAPGYPLFLALTAAPWMNVLPALIIQAFLFAFSAVFLYRLFDGAFPPRVRFVAALLYCIEPYSAFTVAEPLSEALFLFLFLGGLLALRRAFEWRSTAGFFWGGILLGASILVRPVAEYIVPLIGLVFLGALYFRRVRRPLILFIAFLVGCVLILLPWAYRNHQIFGVWTLSTKGPYSLYFFDGAEILKYRDNLSAEAATDALVKRAQQTYPEVNNADDLRDPKYAAFEKSETLNIIKESPFLFIKMYAVSLGTFFLSDGYRLLWYEATNGSIVLPNITRAIVQGDLSTIRTYLVGHPMQFTAFVIGLTFWSLVLLLAVLGFIRGLGTGQKRVIVAVLACALLMAYFALVTGPLAQARYRIVVTPYLFMLAAYGAALLLRKLHVFR